MPRSFQWCMGRLSKFRRDHYYKLGTSYMVPTPQYSMPVSTLLQHAYHGTNSAALLPGCMRNRLWCLFCSESRFGINFLVVFFSIGIVSIIIVSLDVPPPLSSLPHLYRCANTCLIAPLLHSGWLSLSSCHRRRCHHYHDRHHHGRRLVVYILSLPPS